MSKEILENFAYWNGVLREEIELYPTIDEKNVCEWHMRN